MKNTNSEKEKASSGPKNPKEDTTIVNEQEQQKVINSEQELHEQDRPSGDYVSEREMNNQPQEQEFTNRTDKLKDQDTNKTD
jgi:hypothetical protein